MSAILISSGVSQSCTGAPLHAQSRAEDWWFVNAPVPLRRPLSSDAEAFAVESVVHPAPAGYHKPYKWIRPDYMEAVYDRIRTVAEAVVGSAR